MSTISTVYGEINLSLIEIVEQVVVRDRDNQEYGFSIHLCSGKYKDFVGSQEDMELWRNAIISAINSDLIHAVNIPEELLPDGKPKDSQDPEQ